MKPLRQAPALAISQWLNSTELLTLQSLQGRVVVLEAFQMLCTGCVTHALPQAQRVHDFFPRDRVVVIGLHAVFEARHQQGEPALSHFLREHKLTFPIAIDQLDEQGEPITLRRYNMQGTPTLVLLDQEGRIRMQRFGGIDDLHLGAAIATLLADGSREVD